MHSVALLRARIDATLAVVMLAILFLVFPAIAVRAAVRIQEVKSDSGVTAWLVEDYTVPIIAVRFAFDGGSTQDPPGKEGLANVMTGLFDEGAGDLDSDAFQSRLDDVGAEMQFDQNRDEIYGSMRMLAENRDEAFDLLRLAVNSPRFDPEPVERIRAEVLSSIQAREHDPNTIARNRWAQALYGSHPYARPEEGTKESVAAITADDLKAAHRALFARAGLHVAVVGAIDAGTLKRELDEVFGGLPRDQALKAVPDTELKLGQTLQVNYGQPQTSLQLVYPGVRRDSPDFYAAAVMNEILGGGDFTSLLFKEVRDKRGLAYSVGSSLGGMRHAALLAISTATRSDRASQTLAVIHDVVKHFVEDGPTGEEMQTAKKHIVGSYAIDNLNSSVSIAATLVELQLDKLGIDYIDRRATYINGVTTDEVKDMAKRLLTVDPAILVVGPPLPAGGKG